jgi:hypothetical protein
MVLLMAGFNFMSHGSQDLYPTMLKNQYQFDANSVTITQVVANLGAIAGGTTMGYCSTIFGRRLTIIVALPIHFYLFQGRHCSRLLRAILRPRCLGCYPHPSHGAIAWLFQNLCRWNFLPTW